MAAVIGALRAELSAQIAGFVADMGKAAGSVEKFQARVGRAGKSMQRVGTQLSAAITAPIVALGALSLQNFFKQQDAVTAIEAKLKSMGQAAGFTSQQLQEMASQLQATSRFGDEDILTKVTQQMLTFGNVTGETFKRAQQATLNLSATLGQDLQQSAIMVGKALNDPIQGLTSLRRIGIQFSDDQKTVIKALVETGDVAGAQAVMLTELERQFGGTAAAAGGTLRGQLDQLNNAWGDMLEQVGAIVAQVLPPLIEGLKGAVQWFAALSPETKQWIVIVAGIAAVIGPAVAALGLLAIGFSAISLPVAAVIAGITALTVAVVAFWPEITAGLDAAMSRLNDALLAIQSGFTDMVNAVTAAILAVQTQFSLAVDAIIASAQRLYEGVKGWVVDKLNAVWDLVGQGVDKVKGFFSDLYQAVVGGSIIPDLVTGIEAWMQRMSASMQSTTQAATTKTASMFDGLGQQITGALSSAFQDGKFSFKSFAKSMFDIAKSMVEKIINEALKPLDDALSKAFSGLFGGGNSAGGGLFSGLGNLFAGFFADGGSIGAGQFGIVGEAGPEAVWGPATVAPADSAGGGMVINNYVTVTNPGDERQARNSGRVIARQIGLALQRVQGDLPRGAGAF